MISFDMESDAGIILAVESTPIQLDGDSLAVLMVHQVTGLKPTLLPIDRSKVVRFDVEFRRFGLLVFIYRIILVRFDPRYLELLPQFLIILPYDRENINIWGLSTAFQPTPFQEFPNTSNRCLTIHQPFKLTSIGAFPRS
jgi:hypothetical protein